MPECPVQLTGTIGAFIDRWNDRPRPFAWTNDTDEILASINRAKTKQALLQSTGLTANIGTAAPAAISRVMR